MSFIYVLLYFCACMHTYTALNKEKMIVELHSQTCTALEVTCFLVTPPPVIELPNP